jgi:SulP family sulfate permease
MLGGLLQWLFGFFRLGTFINLVPYPVISGFMSGIGCIIIILQLPPLVGAVTPEGGMLHTIAALPAILATTNLQALLPGLIALAIVFLTPEKIRKLLPPPLLALVIGTLVASLWFTGAPVIGAIPSGLPGIQMPVFTLTDFPVIIRYALILAFLGSIDSLLTSLVADSLTRTAHDSNRELRGQGIGNFVAGLFGAIPGAGATMRTVINIRSGGISKLSGMVHAIVLFTVVMGFSEAVVHIPHAVLAGILIKVGIDIIDWRYLKRILRAPKAGVIIMLTTLVLTVVIDLITAVAVGMVMASLLFVKRMAVTQQQHMHLASQPDQVEDLDEEEAAILEKAAGRIVHFHVEGPMSFGSAKDIARVLRSSSNQDVLIINLGDVTFIDSSASITLEEVIIDVQKQGDTVILCGLGENVRDVLSRFGIIGLIRPDCIVNTRLEAMRKAHELLGSSTGPES